MKGGREGGREEGKASHVYDLHASFSSKEGR